MYATILNWKDSVIILKALHTNGNTIGKISKVELLGSDVKLNFIQDKKGLTITPEETGTALPGIANQSLAAGIRVLRITHSKGWFNDDDPGVIAPGWFRQSNLGTGDFNNDLTVSDTSGDVWTSSFVGKSISVIAPKEAGAGKIEIKIDGKALGTVSLSTDGDRKPQQMVFQKNGLTKGKHFISIINRGSGKVAVDALHIQ